MPILGRRTVRLRGTVSKVMQVAGCGALRFVYQAKDASCSASFETGPSMTGRRQLIAAQRQRDAERIAAADAQKTPEQRASEQQAEVKRLLALSKWRAKQLQMLRALQKKARPKRLSALAATSRIAAMHATLDTPDPMQLFCVAGKKLRDAFKRDPVVAELVDRPIMQVSSWPQQDRARMVRDFFKRAGVNPPVGIDVRDSLQNNGEAGKGGFLAGKSACAAGTVLGMILPSTMPIDEASDCMGKPWEDGVQREFGQLLGGLFNTKRQANDQEINAAIYTIGSTHMQDVPLAAVISKRQIQPGDEIILQYNNKA